MHIERRMQYGLYVVAASCGISGVVCIDEEEKQMRFWILLRSQSVRVMCQCC